MLQEWVVSKDGSTPYQTITSALEALPENGGIIRIKRGLYAEKISVTKDNTVFLGEVDAIISYGDCAQKQWAEGEPYGTFRTASVFIGANHFTAKNMTFVNDSGLGRDVGQALSMYVDGDKAAFYDCTFLASQDTIFLSPLPPSPILAGSFKGAGTTDPDVVHRSYFKCCNIKGDVDFIFGGATAVFNDCTIVSNNLDQEVNGYITAASTPQNQKWGFVFLACHLVGELQPESVYLGRPWRDFAHTAFINCEMGAHIKKEGWHNWDKPHAETSIRYEEFGSYGLGGHMENRVPWAKNLTEQEAKNYTVEQILGDWVIK